MKYISNALENLGNKGNNDNASVLQRVLAIDNNTKIACVLALDMFLVGVDTVR